MSLPVFYPPFLQHQAPDQSDLMSLQRNLVNWLAGFAKQNPFAGGRLVTTDGVRAANGEAVDGILFAGAQTRTINHALGRVPIVVMVARSFGGAGVLTENKAVASATSVTLTSSASCTVHLWVG